MSRYTSIALVGFDARSPLGRLPKLREMRPAERGSSDVYRPVTPTPVGDVLGT